MPKVDNQGNCLSKICSLGKKSTLPRGKKCRYFPHNKSTNLFPFDIDRVIRQTYTHICMHLYIHTYRDIHTFMHICMNSYILTKHPPLSHIDHKQWENNINR